jgi:hypothetical protein
MNKLRTKSRWKWHDKGEAKMSPFRRKACKSDIRCWRCNVNEDEPPDKKHAIIFQDEQAQKHIPKWFFMQKVFWKLANSSETWLQLQPMIPTLHVLIIACQCHVVYACMWEATYDLRFIWIKLSWRMAWRTLRSSRVKSKSGLNIWDE